MISSSKLCTFLVALAVSSGFAQTSTPAKPASESHVDVPPVAAKPEDVGTLDGIIKAFYDVISGPAGQPRQWSRDRSLYIPEIRFVAMSVNKKGRPLARIATHQQFVDASNDYFLKEGFFEQEIHRTTQRFGNVAHIWSTYESRNKADGPIIARGINSIELFWDGTRWWVASGIWDDERPDNPIPAEYLPKK